MATASTARTVGPEAYKGYWWRVLRPLIWWLLLFLVLLGIHEHYIWIERTRIYFSVTMYETNVLNDAVATLDGRQIESGEKISLDPHFLTVTEPKAERLTTNFNAWYGTHNLGRINLNRAMGTLAVTSEPPAKEIVINGPEFRLTLHNATGTNVSVPTDTYRVSARYGRWSEAHNCSVTEGKTASCPFAPEFGAISMTCNESPAEFELKNAQGSLVERGDLPADVAELPAGTYFISVMYKHHTLKQEIVVRNKETNSVPFHFAFGAIRFESQPSGANIYSTNGDLLGTTPALMTELPTGTTDCHFELNGYASLTLSVAVVEGGTTTVSVTLTNLTYLRFIQMAKEDMASGHSKDALAALEQALVAKPRDEEALRLQIIVEQNERADTARRLVQTAKDLAGGGDYLGAGKKLQTALELLPDNAEAKVLQTEYKSHEAGQLMRLKAKQTREAFDRACKANPDASLFEEHSVIITNLTVEAFRDAFVHNCETVSPIFKVFENPSPGDGICQLFVSQGANLLLVAMRIDCIMVIGSDNDGHTLVLFKVLNLQKNAASLGDALGGNGSGVWVPLHPSRIQMTSVMEDQIRIGLRMISKKISDSAKEHS